MPTGCSSGSRRCSASTTSPGRRRCPATTSWRGQSRTCRACASGAADRSSTSSCRRCSSSGSPRSRVFAPGVSSAGGSRPRRRVRTGSCCLHPDVLAELPYWWFHRLGVERRRAPQRVIACARHATAVGVTGATRQRRGGIPAATHPGRRPMDRGHRARSGPRRSRRRPRRRLPRAAHGGLFALAGEVRGSDERMRARALRRQQPSSSVCCSTTGGTLPAWAPPAHPAHRVLVESDGDDQAAPPSGEPPIGDGRRTSRARFPRARWYVPRAPPGRRWRPSPRRVRPGRPAGS